MKRVLFPLRVHSVLPSPFVMRTLAICMFVAPATAAAQVPWDSPQLMAPGAPYGISILFVDYGLRPDDGTGVLIGYRTDDAPAGYGLRFASTLPLDTLRISAGFDIAVPLFERSATFPLDVLWTSGVGAAWGRYGAFGVPFGIAAGRTITGDNIWFNPWSSRMPVSANASANSRSTSSDRVRRCREPACRSDAGTLGCVRYGPAGPHDRKRAESHDAASHGCRCGTAQARLREGPSTCGPDCCPLSAAGPAPGTASMA